MFVQYQTKLLWNCVLKSTQCYCQLIYSYYMPNNSYEKLRVVWLWPFKHSSFFVLFGTATRKSAALIISSVVICDCTPRPTTSSPPKVKIKIWSQKWKKPVREFSSFGRASVFLQLSNYDGKKGRPFWSNWWRVRLSASICVVCSLLSG